MKKYLFVLLFTFFSTFSLLAESDMILIPSGKFTMGSPDTEKFRNKDEKQHDVTISSFYVDRYEVQQQDYEAVMGNNPSFNKGDNLPVENVSYYDAIKYCNKKSLNEKLTPCYIIEGRNVIWDKKANGYRLLTEAEWEYACRAETQTIFNTGDWTYAIEFNYDGENPYMIEENYFRRTNRNVQLGQVRGKTIPVDSLEPNAFGLYNMHGNVREWVFDLYGEYELRNYIDPVGAKNGIYRINRGGGFNDSGKHLRCANRSAANPKECNRNLGFRIAKNATEKYSVVETKFLPEVESIIIPPKPKVLIAYYSFTGNTKTASKYVSSILKKNYGNENVDLIELEMAKPYTDEVYEESQYDLANGIKPKLKNKIPDFDEYNIIILGFPIWWATIPMPIVSFINSYDFTGKTVLSLSSHSGTMFGDSQSDLHKLMPLSNVCLGFDFYYGGGRDLENGINLWLEKQLGIKKF